MIDPLYLWWQVGNSPEITQRWQQAEDLRIKRDWQGALKLYEAIQESDDPWREGSTLSSDMWAMAGIRRSAMLAELGQGWEAREVVEAVGEAMSAREQPMNPVQLLAYYYARIHAAVVIKDEVGLLSPMREALDIAVNQLREPQRVVEIWSMVLWGLALMEEWPVLRLRSNQASQYLALLEEPHRSTLAATIAQCQALAEKHKEA